MTEPSPPPPEAHRTTPAPGLEDPVGPVGLLLITHQDLGEALLHTAASMLGATPEACIAVPCSQRDDPDEVLGRALQARDVLDQGAGVLILTDIYGSTPANVALRVAGSANTRVVAGVNLPMLIRVLNYRGLPLPDLITKAVSGGHDGILLCEERHDDAP